MNWLEPQDDRNLSWRAEQILAEIRGISEESPVEVPDSPLSFAEVASAIMFGRIRGELEREWWIR